MLSSVSAWLLIILLILLSLLPEILLVVFRKPRGPHARQVELKNTHTLALTRIFSVSLIYNAETLHIYGDNLPPIFSRVWVTSLESILDVKCMGAV